MLFNIHTEKDAQDTLKRLTSIPFSVWERESAHFNEYKYCDDFLEATIKSMTNRYHGLTILILSYLTLRQAPMLAKE